MSITKKSLKNMKISKGGLTRWNFSFTTLKFLFRKKSVEIFQEAKCVSWNIIQFVYTIMFHLHDHDNVSFIERINNFHFYSFKSCLKSLVTTSFSIEIWSLIREMYFRRKTFYQKSGKNFFFWNTFMIVDWKISLTFRSCMHASNVQRKPSKKKFNHLWKKIFIA